MVLRNPITNQVDQGEQRVGTDLVDLPRPRPDDLLENVTHHVLRPRTLIAFGFALFLVYVLVRVALDVNLGETWLTLRDASPGFLGLGLVVFYLVYVVRAARWQLLLANAGFTREDGYSMPSFLGFVRLMVVAAFANSVTVAQLGDAYRAYLLKQESRVSFPATLGTILAERIVDIVVLVAMLSVAVLTAFAGRLPRDAVDVLVLGLVLAAIGVALLGSIPRLRMPVERMIPRRWHDGYRRFEVGSITSLQRIPVLLAYSVAGWLIEGITIYLLATAVAATVSASGALVAGLVSSLLSIEPFTPGGLGATETGIVLVLTGLGVPADAALAVAVLNRVVNYLSLAIVGPLIYVAPRVLQAIAGRVQALGSGNAI